MWESLYHKQPNLHFALNPLTPVLAVTSHDKLLPSFLFWSHHLWPKLASSVLKFCKRKRSFQRYPDQSDWLSGAWNIHGNAQKFECKTQSKIACYYTWLLHGKICTFRWRFLGIFWTWSKLSRRLIISAKRWEKEKKERRKKD